jgi:NAD(P)-dependent dehydrogenase (short-subunit alcohol dehydrogenase family)
MQDLSGKVAFITGGANGIGFGMVRAFLSEGMKVVVADWSPANIEKAKARLAGNNAVAFVRANVADRSDLKSAVDEALEVFGKIHVLCNNAGVNGGGTADDPDFDGWDKAMAVNLGGVVNGTKLIAPIIKAQGEGGHVVCTSSMAGVVPLPGLAAYSTAKYAVRGFAESLRMQLAPLGIGVSCLFPGATRTGMLYAPEDKPEEAIDEAAASDFQKALWDAARDAIDPLDTGRAVVEAIKENRFHIFTNREFLDEVIARNREMEAAFPVQDPPPGRVRFETLRAELARNLLATGERKVGGEDAGGFGLDLNTTAVD